MLLLLKDLLLETFHLGSLLSLEGLPLFLHLLPFLLNLLHILSNPLLLLRHPLSFVPCLHHRSLVIGILVHEVCDLVLKLCGLVLKVDAGLVKLVSLGAQGPYTAWTLRISFQVMRGKSSNLLISSCCLLISCCLKFPS